MTADAQISTGSGPPTARVLVVDDESMVAALVARTLTGSGHEALCAPSAEEAIRVVEREQVDVVVTDINMPGRLSGLELIDELHRSRPSLPIILLTGAGEEGNLQQALDRGAAGFITKPFAPEELRNKVAAALSRVSLVTEELREQILAPTVASVLANAIEVRDGSMEGHTERLASLALELGRNCRLSDRELEELALGAVLHDVGKIGIPDRILMKPGPLTPDERKVIEQHTVIGDRMLARVALLAPVRLVVRHHHERWDGVGYPDGLAGEAIPLLARIVGLADSLEAMSADRPYRRPLAQDAVLAELERGRGRQWDPSLADRALDLINTENLRFGPVGMTLVARS